MESFFKLFIPFLFLISSCTVSEEPVHSEPNQKVYPTDEPYLVVLGVAQDAGYPQAACPKTCCKKVWEDESLRKMVSCIGIVDPISNEYWIIDATPDFPDQMFQLNKITKQDIKRLPNGIFLTHAHIGHYTGLIHLGREVIGAKKVDVHAMPRMSTFLRENGPWSQLVTLENIKIQNLVDARPVQLNSRLQITPFLVPHRDEFSETVGYKIQGPSKSALFIPDINKWQDWNQDILKLIKENGLAFLDGTFYKNGEIPNRDMSEIPHPFIEESMQYFQSLSTDEKSKIHFIHFNHTNPVLWDDEAVRAVERAGFGVAVELGSWVL